MNDLLDANEILVRWPTFRFGQILEARDGSGERVVSLTQPQAEAVGSLFNRGAAASRRYSDDHLEALRELTRKWKGEWRDAVPSELKLPEPETDIRVQYHHVPIISFPHYYVVLGRAGWYFREAVTVCAEESHSKVWLHAILASVDGKSTKTHPVALDQITALRLEFGAFADAAMGLFVDFYRTVLTVDAPTLPEVGVTIPDMRNLHATSLTEISGVMSNTVLSSVFDRIADVGVSRACEVLEAPEDAFLRAFRDWFEQMKTRPTCTIDPDSKAPQLLTIPIDGVVSESKSRALMLSARFDCGPKSAIPLHVAAVLSNDGEAEYHSIAPAGDQDHQREGRRLPLSQIATGYLASEYGRRF